MGERGGEFESRGLDVDLGQSSIGMIGQIPCDGNTRN